MLLKKWLLSIAIGALALTVAAPVASANAGAPYEAYTVNYYRDSVPLPAPFLPDRTVSGADLGVGDFKDPSDMFVTDDGFVYILDSGNGRIVQTDSNWKLIRVITGFDNAGTPDTFANPSGIFVSEDKRIYVADTDHNRIVILTSEGELDTIVEQPENEILPVDFKFVPVKLTADKANRIFVVARGIYEGLMQFDETGEFIGYVGTISVPQSFADKIWKRLATDAQREQMRLFIPTEFSNVDADKKGFIYSTNIDLNSDSPIKRLNPSGQDVLKRFGYFPVRGDVLFRIFGNNSGPSRMVDIKVLDGGIFIALDGFRGRLFAYNDEGELLYAFGGRGTQTGIFNTPVAVERLGDKLTVLDRGKNSIAVYKPTLFGSKVHEAVTLQYNGYDSEAVPVWREVLRINSNFDIAYVGIGRSLLMEKKNKEAMEYFKLGMQRKYYSVAFKRYRREVMQEHFGTFMTVVVALVAALIGFRIAKKWRKRGGNSSEAGLL